MTEKFRETDRLSDIQIHVRDIKRNVSDIKRHLRNFEEDTHQRFDTLRVE